MVEKASLPNTETRPYLLYQSFAHYQASRIYTHLKQQQSNSAL